MRAHTTLSTFRAQKDKTLNLHSTVFRHQVSLVSSSSFFPQPILLSLFLSPAVPLPSPRPNAAHNSRSQFSISADFSIRLRGAAVLTRGTRPFLRGRFLLLPLPPLFLCTNTRMSHRCDDIANWKALEFLSPPPRVFLTSGQPNRVDATSRLKKAMSWREYNF